MSLADCIKKAGKALSKSDRMEIEASYKRYVDDGADDASAAMKAIDDLSTSINRQLDDILSQVEAAGGAIKQPDALRDPITREDAEYTASQIAGRIMGTPDGRLPYDYKMDSMPSGAVNPKLSGVFKKRSFNIPDELVEDFLENDIEVLASRYKQGTAPDIEIKAEFGDVEMTAEREAIRKEYADMAKAAGGKKGEKLIEEGNARIKDIAAMRDRIRGKYGQVDPNNVFVRAGRVARDLNYMRFMGGVVAASIPDVGRIVMAEGLVNSFKGLGKAVYNLKAFKVAAKEAKEYGIGIDVLMGGRADIIADVADYAQGGTAFERGVRSLANKFSTINLMNYWTAGTKQLHAVTMQNRLINELLSGKIDPRLKQLGIDDANAQNIAKELKSHAKNIDGIYIANHAEWDSPALKEMWVNALRKESDRVIIVPGQEKPLFMSNELGKSIMQFKSFMFSSTQRVMISGLQKQDKAYIQGLMTMVSFGMMSYAFKQWDAGRDLSDDPKAWVVEGIDRAGALGILMEANNTLEKMSYNNMGLRPMLGISAPASRYASRSNEEALLGPSLGSLLSLTLRLAAGLSGEEGWQESDTRALRRLLPGQNLSLLRQIFDKLEEEL